MEPIYEKDYYLSDMHSDAFGRAKPAALLSFAQDIAGEHAAILGGGWAQLQEKKLFWAVTRHRMEIFCPPKTGETLRIKTWPMVTTRVAYPRCVEGYRKDGRLLFRIVSLWVLMDTEKRSLVLPGRSGVEIRGCNFGTEGAAPHSILPGHYENNTCRAVSYSDLDRNQHMNNTRYLEWINDLLPLQFHKEYYPSACSVCYMQELLPAQTLHISWEMDENCLLHLDSRLGDSTAGERIFAAQLQFAPDVL